MSTIGAIFIDGANISKSLTARAFQPGGCRQLVDYGKLVGTVSRITKSSILFKTYYTAHRDELGLENRKTFFDYLRHNGWTVFDREARFVNDRWIDKGVDIAIALDAFRLVMKKQINVLVVATHDADFAELFRQSNSEGVKGYAVGWKDGMAVDLKSSATPLYFSAMPEVLRG